MFVYKITNLINGKIYVGQTMHTIEKRFNQHCVRKKSRPISLAIQKYGKNFFTVEEICTAKNIKTLNDKEKYWIKTLNSMSPNGYNLTTGGQNGKHTEETKEKISQKLTGIRRSKETKKRLSIQKKKLWKNEEFRKKHKKTMESPEFREKRSIQQKKLWENEEFREKRRQSMGKVYTKEVRSKMSKSISKSAKERFKKNFCVYEAVVSKPKGFQVGAEYTKGSNLGCWENQVTCVKDMGKFGIKVTGIHKALNGKTKTHMGFIFEYV